MCPCMLEKAVLHLKTHYRDPGTTSSEFSRSGYCCNLAEKAYQEIHGEIYSQTDLSALVKQLMAKNIELEERVARLEGEGKKNENC